MNKIGTFLVWIAIFWGALYSLPAKAQYMPVVFDKQYGNSGAIKEICALSNTDIALVTQAKETYELTWVDKHGEVVYNLPLIGFTSISEVSELNNDLLLLVGQGIDAKSRAKKRVISGKAIILDRSGKIVLDIQSKDEGTNFLKGVALRNGDFIFSGYKQSTEEHRYGIILKVNNKGEQLYQFKKTDSGYCKHFVVLGNEVEYVCAGFSSDKTEGSKGAVVRLDQNGKPFYITEIPLDGFQLADINANINDGSVTLIGNSNTDQGAVYKIRPEGDIVFEKKLGDTNKDVVKMSNLQVSKNGNIFVGGSNTSKAFYALLRSDGTPLHIGSTEGILTALEMNNTTGESVVVTYNPKTDWGTFTCVKSSGNAEFKKAIDGCFNKADLTNENEVILSSYSQGRVAMFSSSGEKQFDRYISDNKPFQFVGLVCSLSGEMYFHDSGTRVVKLGHGLYVSDLQITKPTNGKSTAVFTVTLTGYSKTTTGTPLPVTVEYATKGVSAVAGVNFIPVNGKLSFTPSRGLKGRYLIKQEIEVPIISNNLIEGEKKLQLELFNAEQSYLIKSIGDAVIEDHQALVKLISTEPGQEGIKDVVYELGLFKTDGTPLKNATGANIVIDGGYGSGTADALDFDMGLPPRVVFADGSERASFNVRTVENTRYELSKSVIVNFDKIYNLSSSNVAFEGGVLSCKGYIHDQPASLVISTLGNHRANSDVISGFFTISLVRSSDGALLTNTTGSDIVIDCSPADESTAVLGKDYIYTNLHELNIRGSNDQSSINVNGVVLHNTEQSDKIVKLRIDKVREPIGAQPISVLQDSSSAEFKIIK